MNIKSRGTVFMNVLFPIDKASLEQQQDVYDPIVICGISISHLPRKLQITLVISGIFFFYIMYSFLQEYLFVSYNGFNYGFFTTLIQFMFYSALSGIEFFKKDRSKPVNYRIYLWVAFLSVTSMGLGYQALAYLSYPTKILFKSSKLLGVMLIGFVFLRKRYKAIDYIASICIFCGLFLIYYGGTNSDESTGNQFDIRGVLLMTCAIAADSLVGNIQDDLLHLEKVETIEFVFFSHSIGIGYLFILCMIFGQFQKPIEYVVTYPSIIVVIFCISLCGYLGVQCVHSLTKMFGILYTVTATSIRKVLTIFLSFLFFPKPLTISYLFAIVFVFAGTFARIKK